MRKILRSAIRGLSQAKPPQGEKANPFIPSPNTRPLVDDSKFNFLNYTGMDTAEQFQKKANFLSQEDLIPQTFQKGSAWDEISIFIVICTVIMTSMIFTYHKEREVLIKDTQKRFAEIIDQLHKPNKNKSVA